MYDNIILTGFADEIDSKLDIQVDVLKELGINKIEMRGVNGKDFVKYSLEEATEVKNYLIEKQMGVSVLASPIGKIDIRADFEPHMELFRHTVELAHFMGTPYIRMFSFFIPRDEKPELFKQEVLERIGQFVDYAGKNEVVLLHENEKGIYGDIAPRCLELMREFYGEHFKAVFDFANFVQCHQNTLDAYELLKPYIVHVHVKDALWENGVVTPAGYGDGHIKEILRKLKAEGYNGYLSLEPHLTEFSGFSGLEKNGKLSKTLQGAEAFKIAHRALEEILKEV